MKKIISVLKNLENKTYLKIWLFFHLAVILFFAINFFIKPSSIGVDADLFNMLPKSSAAKSIQAADEKLTEITGQNVFILVSNKDFAKAKAAAVSAYSQLENSKNFNSLSLYNDIGSLDGVTKFLFDYRWNLLDDATIDLLNAPGGAESFATNALGSIYGGFTMLPLDNIEQDPFMLAEHDLKNYLNAVQESGVAMSVKDGVLASEHDGKWYVMIRGVLSKQGAALASKDNGVSEIYRVCGALETDGTDFVYSGTPFHSHESSNSASREITIISTVSLLVVIIMLILVFKSGIPLVFSVISILVSILTAVLATLGVFHKMHILTLVFGTSLIGSCIDYSVHYFTHWAGNPKLQSGKEIRKELFSGLSLAIVSTSLCFTILLFAPFNLLKQMALFSLVGLISSYLTTICIYPFIPLPKGERNLYLKRLIKPAKNPKRKKLVGRIVITGLFIISILSIVICRKNLTIHNDLNKLYAMEGELLEDEILANTIIQYSPTGWFIVSGDTAEQTLENEEFLRQEIGKISKEKIGYLCTSLFVPSIEKQKASRAACENLLALADYQFESLGYDASYATKLKEDFKKSNNDFVSLEKGNVPEFISESISSCWLGKIDGKYYSVLLPNKIVDAKAFSKLDAYNDNIFFINKMADMGKDLDKLTIMVLKFFAVAYVLMYIVLRIFYKRKQSLKVISVPLLIILVAAAVFAVFKIDLEFFSVTGLILVFGLGLDYIIYMMENEKGHHEEKDKTLEPFAIMLSFITTVVSFGALALSSFVPVHLIGLVIFIGLTTAYFSTFFYDRSF